MSTSATPLHVLVLAGGISHEREVSLRSGRRVADALAAAGHRVTLREPDAATLAELSSIAPDVVFPALHGVSGESGALQELLEAAHVPYVASSPAALRLSWNKATTKELLHRAGIPTPRSMSIPREAFREFGAQTVIEAIERSMPVPVVVKPESGGSSQGVTIVRQPSELSGALVGAYTYANAALIEEFIDGIEIAVSVVDLGSGPNALPPTEIVAGDGTYDYAARYSAGETTYFTPARITAEVDAAVRDQAVAVHATLGLDQLSRIDVMVDADGTAWVLDVNTIPGLTETSLFPQALDAGGLDPSIVYSQLATLASRGAKHRKLEAEVKSNGDES